MSNNIKSLSPASKKAMSIEAGDFMFNATRLNSQNHYVFFEYARFLDESTSVKEDLVKEYYSTAIKLSNSNVGLYVEHYAAYLVKIKNYTGALQLYDGLLQKNANDVFYNYKTCEILYETKTDDKILKHRLKWIINNDTNNYDAMALYVKVLKRSNDVNVLNRGCNGIIQKLIEKYPENDEYKLIHYEMLKHKKRDRSPVSNGKSKNGDNRANKEYINELKSENKKLKAENKQYLDDKKILTKEFNAKLSDLRESRTNLNTKVAQLKNELQTKLKDKDKIINDLKNQVKVHETALQASKSNKQSNGNSKNNDKQENVSQDIKKKYDKCLNEIKDIIYKKSIKPKYGIVKMIESKDDVPRSIHCQGLKNIIRSYNSMQKQLNISVQTQHDSYAKYILSFITINGENRYYPKILILKDGAKHFDKRLKSAKLVDIHSIYKTMKIQNVVQKVKIKYNQKQLKHEYGVKALVNIPKYTVISQYMGFEYLEHEFNDVFRCSNSIYKHELYAFKHYFYVNLKCWDKNHLKYFKMGYNPTYNKRRKDKNQSNSNNNINNNNNNMDPKRKKSNTPSSLNPSNSNENRIAELTFKLMIDAYPLRDKCIHIHINDVRKDLRCYKPTKNEYLKYNTDLVTAWINGWPCMFLITNKMIKSGEYLMTFYGKNYMDIINKNNERLLYKSRLKSEMESIINKHNLNDTDMDIDMMM